MKTAFAGTVAIVGFSLATLVAPTYGQTTGVGPYYATPSWDQTLPASTRFIVLSNLANAAVLDRETGLVWQRSPSPETQSFSSASGVCLGSTTGNRAGWAPYCQ